jgi:PAS domain S-box-containing protein
VEPITTASARFAEEYAEAIEKRCAGREETALRSAYEAGKRALAAGLSVLDIVAVHHEHLNKVLRLSSDKNKDLIVEGAVSCLAECLSPFEMVLRGVPDANARLERSLSSLQSVEEQLRRQNDELTAAHRSVGKERSRYQLLFDFAPDGYLVTGMEGAIREANTAAATLLRTPKELLPGQSMLEFVAPADRAEFRARLHHLHSGAIERIEDWETDIHPREGRQIPSALTVVAERSALAAGGLRWLIRDIRERKRLERERARWLVGRAKAKAARRFEFLAEASALLVGSLDVEASLTSVARLAASFLDGWCFICFTTPTGAFRQLEVACADESCHELVKTLSRHCLFGGMSASERLTKLETPADVEPVSADWCRSAADSTEHAELLRSIGGSATVLPLWIHGRLVGVLTLVRKFAPRHYGPADRVLDEDLARRCALALENARLYSEVVAERDKAEIANRAKDEFVAILGHELRNPLTPVVGWTRVLKSHEAVMQDSLLREGVSSMERNAMTLTRLVGECVDLARISEGKIRIEPVPVDLNRIVMTTAHTIKAMASERGIQLDLDLTPGPAMILGDAMRLEQVVTNLLINAVKYTSRDGTISARTRTGKDTAEIEISDTGIGIDPPFLEQIFEPFRQSSSTWLTSQSGLGLGLAITRRIVEMHGGRVWAESGGLGCGSTFRVRLPLSTGSVSDVPAELTPHQRAVETKSLQILLVEDSDDVSFLVKTELEQMGHRVQTASDGHSAFKATVNEPPDVIISDIKMPIVDGYELIRAIRGIPTLRTLPAIALTGFGSKAAVERALAAGFNACLSKPVEPEQIAAVLDQLTKTAHPAHAGLDAL